MNETDAYDVRLSSTAQRDLGRLPPRYSMAILEFAFGLLADNPRRLGKPLRNDLAGLYGARRGDYRIVYQIIESDQAVLIIRIEHRGHV